MVILADILNEYKTETNANVVSLPPHCGKWYIPEEKYQKFLEDYSQCIDEHPQLTELHSRASPILIDIDFKFPIDNGCERIYNNNHLMKLVKMMNDVITMCLNVELCDIHCFLFEKSSPVNNCGYIKDGIHIVYPYIITGKDIQYHMRELFINKIVDSRLFSDIPVMNSVQEIVDKAVIHQSGWFLYKSAKNNMEPYILTKIINLEEEMEFDFTDEELVKLLSIQYKTENVETKIKLVNEENKEFSDSQGNIDEMETAKKLSSMLNADRSDNRASWIDVGICMYNISTSLLDAWIEFSTKSEKFKNGECEKTWKTFGKDNNGRKLTIASLNMWAKIDNPQRYMHYKREESTNILSKSLECTHYSVAQVLYVKYKFSFVCSSLKHDTWWEFSNHRWRRMDKASTLRKKISTEIAADYMQLSNLYKRRALANPADSAEYMELHKKANKCVSQTQNRGFKDNVIKEAADLFQENDFESKLDKYTELIGFENGVYDLDKCEFRDGCPDDLITLTTQMDFVDFNECEYADELIDFLKKVIPKDDVRKYVLKLISSFLSGKTGEQKFHIWTGSGGNGKSKLIELIESTFGEYSMKVPVTLLTGKRASSSACTPEIAICKGKRFLSFQEPEKEDKIHVGHMKELSGGDTIMARPLWSPPITFKPQFKMILACNDLPTIPSDDNGTWRRIRVVDFPSKFVDDPNPNEPNEFRKDVELADKLIRWKKTFMGMLLEFYKKHKKEKMEEPESVLKFTREYQKKSDIFMDFVTEKLETTNNKKDILTITNTYSIYKMWHIEFLGEKAPNRNVFKDSMEKKFGPMKSGWKGLKLKGDFEEDI
jgi:P4 family phage/plasmid primase-like protien